MNMQAMSFNVFNIFKYFRYDEKELFVIIDSCANIKNKIDHIVLIKFISATL